MLDDSRASYSHLTQPKTNFWLLFRSQAGAVKKTCTRCLKNRIPAMSVKSTKQTLKNRTPAMCVKSTKKTQQNRRCTYLSPPNQQTHKIQYLRKVANTKTESATCFVSGLQDGQDDFFFTPFEKFSMTQNVINGRMNF